MPIIEPQCSALSPSPRGVWQCAQRARYPASRRLRGMGGQPESTIPREPETAGYGRSTREHDTPRAGGCGVWEVNQRARYPASRRPRGMEGPPESTIPREPEEKEKRKESLYVL